MVDYIEHIFKLLDEPFDRKCFMDSVKSFDPETIKQSVTILWRIMTESKEDRNEIRDAYRMLRHIQDRDILACLTDNLEYFKEHEEEFPKNNIYYSLITALIGAKKICEYLITKYSECNPKRNTYLLSYAICSGDTEWVKSLVERWQVNIKDSVYCFTLFAHRYNRELL